jgi:peptidoglycan/xylan/chitin deacetylase (PgdA/CDA1 family)
MAKKSGKSGKVALILIFVLVMVLGVSVGANYLLQRKFTSKKNEYKELTEKYDKIKKDYDKKVEEVKSSTEDLKKYDDLDKQITEAKKNYYSNIKKLEDDIAAGKSTKKIAYLTFDDGPYYNTYNVLKILEDNDILATFFTQSGNGEKCFDNKNANCYDLYKEYYKRGHTIANHTYTHAIFKGLYKSVATFMDAIDKQHEHIIKYSGGYVPNIMRFPGGSATAGKGKSAIITELRKRNYGWVDWTAQDGDGGDLKSTTQAWSNFKGSIGDKFEVVLFHDYDKRTTAILPDVIKYLKEKGYEIHPLFYESRMINK